MSALDKIRRPRVWASAALVTIGVTSGAILGSTFTANAATSGTSSPAASSSSSSTKGLSNSSSNGSSSTPAASPQGRGCHGGPHGLPDSGTVGSVGSSSVTIDGKTYAVTSSSDIDKNGEAGLSDLKVGDKVTFSTVSGAATPTIDKLHAGNAALDRPVGPPAGGPRGDMSQQQNGASTSAAA